MRCPNCNSLDTQVKDSRPTEDSSVIRRRRVCVACNFRFTTFERVQLRELTVIKRNGRRVPFDRDKLMRSVQVSLRKRPVETERVEKMVSGIVREAFCPVIAVTPSHDPAWVDEAAKRGVYAYIIDGHPKELQSAIEITLRRFAEYQSLHGAFELRNAESLREHEFARLRQRDALELHDSVVQGLAVAHLALQLDHKDESREALLTTLTQAKAIVARAVEELNTTGIPKAQLIRDTAGRTADG